MYAMLVTLDVLKFFDNVKFVSDEQSLNIDAIPVTLDVSKPLRSKLVNAEQPWNICDMFVTLDVSKPPRSKLVKFLQL